MDAGAWPVTLTVENVIFSRERIKTKSMWGNDEGLLTVETLENECEKSST